MERKFPQENFRNNPKQPLLELGLLDVVVGIENGPQALFHRVASYLKDHYLDPVTKIGIFDAETTPKIIITSRGANARLYTSQYGFDFTLENNNRKKTADGMYVLEISIAKFVHLFYGKRLYPATKGETDFWLSFFNNYKSKIDNAKSYAASVYSHIVSLQRPDFWMTAKPQLDPRVNTESLYSQWMNEIAQMDKLLIEEDILNLDVKLRKLRRSIWNWEPIQVNVTEVPVQMGSGFFSWNYTVQHTSWDFRNRTHLGFNSDDW